MECKAYIVQNDELNYDELEEKINQIHESNNKLKNSDIPVYKNEINALLESLKKSNNKYKKKTKSCILSLIVAFSISTGLSLFINKKLGNQLMYKTIEYTYADDTTKEKRGNTNNILIKEYGYWNEEGTERINKIYDVSEYTFEDIKDYLNIDLTSVEYILETDYFKNSNTLQDINNEGKKVLIKNISEKDLSFKVLINYIILSLMICLGIICLVELLIGLFNFSRERTFKQDKYKFETHDIFDRIINNSIFEKNYFYKTYFHSGLFKATEEEKFKDIDQVALNKYLAEMKKPLNEILNEIEKNNELRNEFVRLFNENAYLLNDPNLLLEKYNEALKEYDLLKDKENIDETRDELKQILK